MNILYTRKSHDIDIKIGYEEIRFDSDLHKRRQLVSHDRYAFLLFRFVLLIPGHRDHLSPLTRQRVLVNRRRRQKSEVTVVLIDDSPVLPLRVIPCIGSVTEGRIYGREQVQEESYI